MALQRHKPTRTSIELFTVKDHAGQRLDNFMFVKFKNVPKSKIYNVIRKGEVRVNKKRINPSYKLRLGDIIRLPPFIIENKPTFKPKASAIADLEQRIIYEDQNLLALNKPAGMASHGGSGINFGVIETLRAASTRPYLELVHRLDRETSGCLLLAKKRSILKYLHELLRKGEIIKKYLVLVKGHWPKKRTIDLPLLKNQISSGERIVRVNEAGKKALSTFYPQQCFANCTLLEVELHTGRTHQIRVHSAALGHPVAGDDKYGDKDFNSSLKIIGLKRMFLHASSISFYLSTGQKLEIKAELPNELSEMLKQL